MASGVNRREFLGISGAAVMTGMMGARLASGIPAGDTAAGGVGATSGGTGKSTLMTRPNIVLFMPDEMRADSLACYGNPVTKTPNFDRLAKEGTRFSNCHVQFPVCGASRCSMLTGWPTSVRGHRSLYYYLRPEEPNLFRYLRQAGYDVFWYGKNDALAAQCFYDSVTEWEDAGYGRMAAEFKMMKNVTPGSASMMFTAVGDRRENQDYLYLKRAFQILERRETDRPFCIFLPLLNPHPPYTISEDFYNLYSPSDIPAPIPPGLKRKPAFHEGIREMYGLKKLDEATYRKVRAVYYGKVSFSDWLLGELMEVMEKTGRVKDTALFMLSDHGDYAGDFGLVEKWPSGLEDCLTHVPLIGRVPGGKSGVVSEEIVELYDIMQTALDLAGTSANHTHFARSLVPQLGGEAGDPNRAAFSEGGYNIYEPQCFPPGGGAEGGLYAGKTGLQNEKPVTVSRSAMIRTRTHKLIVRPQDQSELYCYKDDPQERDNLFGDKSTAAIRMELQAGLLDHYINTTGIAPFDKDSRNAPPFYPSRTAPIPPNWQEIVLDNK